MKKLVILVNNPYYEKRYETHDIVLGRWENFVHNHTNGNENIMGFKDELTEQYITINPQYFSSVEVYEVE